jgi:hypothetical protein
MKLARLARRLGGRFAVLMALPVVLGASGCHTFKYVDMKVQFDYALDDSTILTIQRCRIIVSGADSDNFILNNCPNHVAADPHVGDPNTGYSFEFSTFADSGTLNFDFKGYQGLRDLPECLIAEGTQSVPVTSLTTLMGSISVLKGSGAGCSGVSPTTDGGP